MSNAKLSLSGFMTISGSASKPAFASLPGYPRLAQEGSGFQLFANSSFELNDNARERIVGFFYRYLVIVKPTVTGFFLSY